MRFNKNILLGVVGGSGFLLIIKGTIGLVESIMLRPSSHWRTAITLGNVFVYLVILLGTVFVLQTLLSPNFPDQKSRLIIGSTIGAVLFAVLLTLFLPLFQTVFFRIHPVILILAGAVLLPAMGNLPLRKR